MSPERREMINGVKVEEYYWNGKMVVYVDNRANDDQTFDEVCGELRKSNVVMRRGEQKLR